MWSSHFQDHGKSQAPAYSVSDTLHTLDWNLLECLNQTHYFLIVGITHHKPLPKTCVMPTADGNSQLKVKHILNTWRIPDIVGQIMVRLGQQWPKL